MDKDAKIARLDDPPAGDEVRSSSAAVGLSALLAGVIALGLAVLPGMLLNQHHVPELPPPLADSERDQNLAVEAEDDEGLVVKFKNFRFSFGSKDDDAEDKPGGEIAGEEADQPVAQPEAQPEIEVANHWPARLAFASASFALLGLLLGPIAWARERHPALAGSAMAFSIVALLWHYILAAIIVGVVIVVILLFLSSLW